MKNRPNPYLVSPYSKQQRIVINILSAAWMLGLLFFYVWWFDPSHVVTTTRFWITTIILFWVTFLPAYFFFFVLRARVPNPDLKIPSGWRVAMVVTKVPSESLSMVKNTIKGMLTQQYPHDVWLADEDPHADTITWCKNNGVKIISRRDVPEYHRATWPRRKAARRVISPIFTIKLATMSMIS